MPSKWLAAFREVDEAPPSISEPRANSANSANSSPKPRSDAPIGTIGTIGTVKQSEVGPRQPALTALLAHENSAGEIVGASAAANAIHLDDLDERAAIVEHDGGIPRAWAEGFAALCGLAPPPGFAPERWRRIIDAAGMFLDKWAAEAVRCGWDDLDVFGADPDRPDARFDAMGLVLLLDRAEVVAIDAEGADLVVRPGNSRQRFRRRPLPPNTVSLWQLVRR